MTRGTRRYAAFLSYSHVYRPWVEAFHRDLQAGLRKHHVELPVFLDDRGLRPGEPWIGQLERALAEAERFVLVVTPEALASPWSRAEQDAFRGETPPWRDRFLCVRLVPAPLSPFLQTIQYVDLAGCDAETHRERLAKILAWLLDWQSSEFPPELPAPLATPLAPRYELSAELRDELIGALSPLLDRRSDRRLLAGRSSICCSRGATRARTLWYRRSSPNRASRRRCGTSPSR